MSQPKNHHYISQTHIKKFFNQNSKKIYIYDKRYRTIKLKLSSKKIFSEENLNTMLAEDGFDYKTVENHLNINFENDFNQHFSSIHKYLETEQIQEETKRSLIFFAKYAAIGNSRNPEYKKEIDDLIFNSLQPYYDASTMEQKKEFYKHFRPFGDKKYSNFPNDLEIAEGILKRMGKINFIIFVPENIDDYFILPDYCSLTIREKINTYFNPDIREISIIGFPLSSKIYIEFYSEKSCNSPEVSGILKITSKEIQSINQASLILANKIVACEDKTYLENLVNKALV